MPLDRLHAMPRRHPLPHPARPATLARLGELQLAGATTAKLWDELRAEPNLAARVESFSRLDPLGLGEACSPGELCGLTLAATLLAELEGAPESDSFEQRLQATQALLVSRLCLRLAAQLHRPLGLPPIELFCLPLVQACARARGVESVDTPAGRTRASARLAAAWGLSGPAVEALSLGGPEFQPSSEHPLPTLLELGHRLAAGASGTGRRGDLEGAASLAAARALGLRPAELSELAGFAVSAFAEQAA